MKAFSSDRLPLFLASLGFILLWQLAATLVGQPILLPSPVETLVVLGQMIPSPKLYGHVGATLLRSLIALVLSFGLALTGAAAAYARRGVRLFLRPLLLTIRSVPTIAVILLALIWLQSSRAPLFVGFLILFPTLYETLLAGFDGIDIRLIEMVRSFGLDRKKRWRALYLPAIGGAIRAAIRTGAGLGLKVIIAAEVLSQPRSGIGAAMHLEKIYLNTAGVFAWALVAVLVAGLMERGFDLLLYRRV